MKNFLVLLLAFGAISAQADSVYAPNLKKNVTGTDLGGGHTGLDISGSITASSASVGATGSSVPTSADFIGAKDGSGNLQGLLLGQQSMANSLACVLPSNQSAIPVSQSGTWNINNISGTVALPSGAATSAKQDTGNTSVASIDTKTPALGQALAAGSVPVVLTAAQVTTLTPPTAVALNAGSNIVGKVGIDQTTPGTTNGVQVNAALPAGTNVIGKAGIDQTTPGTTNKVYIGTDGTVAIGTALPAGTALIGKTGIDQTTPGTTNKVSIGTDGTVTVNALPAGTASIGSVKIDPAVTGSGSSAGATVSTVATLTAPANCIGFILMNLDTSTANVRWAVGRTASTTLGQQLQPGRDTGFVPIGANVSVIAESGTQNIDIQWIAK